MSRRFKTLAIVFILGLMSVVSLQAAERRVALVIGNSNYAAASRLKNTENDARSIAAVFKSLDFDAVELSLDQPANELRNTVQRFARQAAAADVAIVFYAGHGIEIQGNNYLIPIDARLRSDVDVEFEAISLDLVMRATASARQLRLIILDACRENPFLGRMEMAQATSRTLSRGLARVDPVGDTLIAYAAKAGSIASDGVGRNSPFTTALLQHLPTPGLDIRLMFGRVRDTVMTLTRREQEPYVSGSLGGREIYLRPPAPEPHGAGASTQPAFDPRAVELSFWESVRGSSSAAVIATYLELYPQGTFAALARARIQELERQHLAALPPSPPTSVAAPQSPASPAPIYGTLRLGVSGPITGSSAAFGSQLKIGAEQAVADLNAAGGILGQKVVLEVGDDRADPKEGVSVANKFAADGVKFVIGHFNSGITIPASEVYQENGILEITPSATNPRVTDRGMWNIFRVCGRDDQQGGVAGALIASKFGGKRIAIVHDKTVYGQGLAEGARKAMAAKGMRDVLFEGVNRGDKDFTALVARLKAVKTDLVYWGGLHDTAALILRQMRDQGLDAPMMGGDGMADDEFASIAGPGAEGTLMTFSPDPRTNPKNKEIVDLFRKKRGFEPQFYTLYSYAAVQIIKQAAEAAKSLDPKKVAEVMHSGKQFDTVLGTVSFDKKGDVSTYIIGGKPKDRYVLYTWKKGADGRITYVENTQ
jgi:branched-chain amino acid transport system substrate-binding protein